MRNTLLVWIIVGLAGLSGCFFASDTPQVEKDINVILVLPLTGAFQARGEIHQRAIQMAFAQLTEQGDLIPDRPLRVWLVDSTSDASKAEERLRALIEQQFTDDGGEVFVAAIISSSEPAQAGSLPVALELEIPHFEVSSGTRWDRFIDAADPRAHRYAFVAQAVGDVEAFYVAEYITTVAVWEKLVILRGTTLEDRFHAQLVRTRLAQLGWDGDILEPQDVVMEYGGELAWRDYLEPYRRDSPNELPSVIYFKLSGDRHVRDFLSDAKLIDVFSNLVTSGTTVDPQLLDPVNPGVVDFLHRNYSFSSRSPISAELGNPYIDAFRTDFMEFTGSDAYELWAPAAFDAAITLGLGFVAAGSTEGEAVADAVVAVSQGGTRVGYDDIAGAVEMARGGADIDYDGASGSFDIRDDPIDGSERDTARAVPGELRINEARFDGEAGEYVTLQNPTPEIR